MAKYYVECGNIQTVISADDSEKAALWIVHRVMQQVAPVYDEAEQTPAEKSQVAVQDGLMVLGSSFRISEVGFGHTDSVHLDTFELLVHWNQLMVALAKLESMVNSPAA